MEEAGEKRQTHVRPKVRSKRTDVVAAAPNETTDSGDMDKLLEHTRQRIQSQLEISSSRKQVKQQTASRQTKRPQVSSSAPLSSQVQTSPSINKPKKGILKTSKYSHQQTEAPHKDTDENVKDSSSPSAKNKPRAAVKHLVVEREPTAPSHDEPLAAGDALAVEGHIPKQETDKPVVFSSISNLMSQAGTLPSQQDSNAQVIEADLSFACMTCQEYDETVKCAAESMDISLDGDTAGGPDEGNEHDVFLGTDNVFFEDEDYISEDDNDSSLEGNDCYTPPEARAFMKLWEAITDWVTSDTISLLKQWRTNDVDFSESACVPQVDQSDLGSARRKGLNSMITMYLSSTLDVLGLQQDDKRRVEMRLDNFLRTLSFSKPMAKLSSKLWKAMTCVLVDMVLLDSTQSTNVRLPAPAKEVGMVADEYKYLTRSAVTNLES
jgi:hypothetical protein